MLFIFLYSWFALAAWMTIAWLIQRKTANAGVVDVMWAIGLGLTALYFGLVGDGSMMSRLLVAMLAGVWATRLAMHLLVRVLYEAEDGRYLALRERWGAAANARFFVFFQLQALIALMFSIPFWVAAQNPSLSPSLWTVVAVVVWTVAVVGEALSDYQLSSFRVVPSNRGKTCRYGLWRYSRHPNYFFELLHWCAYVFLAIGFQHAWLALFGPLAMLVFLYLLTGIPSTERQALRSRGEDYREYQRTTSALIPWFVKRPEAVVSAATSSEQNLNPTS